MSCKIVFINLACFVELNTVIVMTNQRYIKNEKMLSREENLSLREKKVAVVGCGGLGGFIIEELGRLGIGHITAVDGDVFEESNLNRQLLSEPGNIGQSKAIAAKKRIETINSDIKPSVFDEYIDENNAEKILKGHHIVCDALDNIPSRKLIRKACRALNIPLIYGAIAGWYGYVSTIFPEDNTLDFVYDTDEAKGEEQELGNPSFTPALIASLQVAEAVKLLTGKGKLLRNKLLFINCLEHNYEIFELDSPASQPVE